MQIIPDRQRYTYAGWFTFDKNREDQNAVRIF
jgi:hypothetical protein